jgi:hypothetical protein
MVWFAFMVFSATFNNISAIFQISFIGALSQITLRLAAGRWFSLGTSGDFFSSLVYTRFWFVQGLVETGSIKAF